MNVCVLGWYGTETLGDRAILEGIIKIFQNIETKNHFYIGSLYPFFTERTVYEEKEALIRLGVEKRILIFDETNGKKLREYIQKADIVIMGGGPLMDLLEIDIIDKAFIYAKKHKKKTGVIGCGIGPLKNDYYRKSVYSILLNSDVSIFRDKNSLAEAKMLNHQFGNRITEKTLSYSNDPAIIPIASFQKTESTRKNRIVVNLRDLSFQSSTKVHEQIKENLLTMLINMSQQFDEVLLLPNHVFSIGGDDRQYFSELKMELSDFSNIHVEHEPKSLFETFRIIAESQAAIGMRYHAIVFQTFLNGNNYILDYTEPKTGKIMSFLLSIDKKHFYKNRYYNLSHTNESFCFDLSQEIFCYEPSIYNDTIEHYVKKIKEVMK